MPPLTFTTNGTFEVGMVDETGADRFNPPSLRGVSHRSRFLHDGSADSLKAVLLQSDHPTGLDWDEPTLHDLLVYLRSL